MTTGDMATPCYLDHVLDTAHLAPERPRPLRRTEYEQLVDAGAFTDERIELLEGVLVSMSPQGTEHADVVSRLTMLFVRVVGDRALVRVQCPFAASDDSEPEPDLALVPHGNYRGAHPTRAFLIVEVAESSLRKDSRIKADLYARSRVDEYWIVDLNARTVLVHTASDGTTFGQLWSASPADSLNLDTLGGGALPVLEFLAPA
jgi:Uma2 family endonuclease